MNTATLASLNDIALARRNIDQLTSTSFQILDRIRHFPYHGFVDVPLPDGRTVVMFTCNDDYVALRIFWEGEFERTSLRLWCALAEMSSPAVLDIGAYTGIYSLLAACISRKSRVHAFEPVDRIYARTLLNRNVNGLPNMQVHRAAVGASDGKHIFHLHAGDGILPTGSSLVTGERTVFERVEVPVVAVDNLAKTGSFPRIGLVKIDAERAEVEVLRGMRGILSKWRPDMLVEILSPEGLDAVKVELNGFGYRFLHVNEAENHLSSEQPNFEAGQNFLITVKKDIDLKPILAGCIES